MSDSSGRTTSTDTSGSGSRAATPLARAWTSVILVPAFFFVSFAAAEGIYALAGDDPSTGAAPPLWAELAAAFLYLAILLLPCVAGVAYGRRAVRSGVRAGWIPTVLAALLGVGAITQTVVTLAVNP